MCSTFIWNATTTEADGVKSNKPSRQIGQLILLEVEDMFSRCLSQVPRETRVNKAIIRTNSSRRQGTSLAHTSYLKVGALCLPGTKTAELGHSSEVLGEEPKV